MWPARLTAACLGLLFAVPATADIAVTIYADASYPPYSYSEGDKVYGIYTEILQQAFSRLHGYRVSIRAEPWRRILAKVKSGDYFAFYPPYYAPIQRPYIAPYSVPILEEHIQPLCRKEVMPGERPFFPSSYFGLHLLRNAGFLAGGEALEQAARDGHLELEEVPSTRQSLKMLAAGRADCYLGDLHAVNYELRKQPLPDSNGQPLQLFAGPVISRNMGYVAYAANSQRFPFKNDFVIQLNQVLDAMRKNGEIDAIQKRYLRQAPTSSPIVPGDSARSGS